MQYVMIRAYEWVRCGKCRNKLFKYTGKDKLHDIEIKCHSCKALNTCDKKECITCQSYYDGCCVNFGTEYFSKERQPDDSCEAWEYRENVKINK